MIYIFLDERIEKLLDAERLIISSFVTSQENWAHLHHLTASIVTVQLRKRLEKIKNILEQVQGMAVLSYSDIPLRLSSSGEIDSTNDIPGMSRKDHIWADAFILNLARILGALCRRAPSLLGNIEIYHDPKSLTSHLRSAFQGYIFRNFPNHAKETGFAGEFQISKVSEVAKAPDLASADRFQLGTTVSHHLCYQARNLIGIPLIASRIEIINHTQDVLEALKSLNIT